MAVLATTSSKVRQSTYAEAASAKISTGMPDDEDEDYEIPIWAGVLPITTEVGRMIADERLLPGVEASDVVRRMQDRTL